MNIYKIELAIAIMLIVITLVLLFKCISEEETEYWHNYKVRNRWKKRYRRRKK